MKDFSLPRLTTGVPIAALQEIETVSYAKTGPVRRSSSTTEENAP